MTDLAALRRPELMKLAKELLGPGTGISRAKAADLRGMIEHYRTAKANQDRFQAIQARKSGR